MHLPKFANNVRRYQQLALISEASFIRPLSTSSPIQPKISEELSHEAWNNAKPYQSIPGPSRFELIRKFMPGGVLHNVTLEEMHRHIRDRYGMVAKFPGMLGRRDIVFSFNPDHYEVVFRTEGAWPLRRGLETFAYYRKHVRPDVFQGIGGLISDQGETWADMRSTVNPVMLRPKTVKSYVSVVDEVAREFMQTVHVIRDENGELPNDFRSDLSMWALETIGVIAVDKRLGVMSSEKDEDSKRLLKAVQDFFKLSYQLEIKPSFWRYYKTKDFRDLMTAFDVLTSIVQKHVDDGVVEMERIEKEGVSTSEGAHEESVLQKLLRVDRRFAVLMVFDMLFGGIDTTSSSLATFLYILANNQDKQEDLRQEVFRLLPEVNSPITEEALNHSPYFKACLKESFRLQPLVPGNMRGAGQDLVLNGYQIPKGTDIAMSHVLPQKDDAYFTKSNKFWPERWLRGSKENIEAAPLANPFSFLPFGFGPRSCIGRRFAEMEIQVLAMRLLREYRVEWHHKPMEYEMSFVVSPISPLRYKLIRDDRK